MKISSDKKRVALVLNSPYLGGAERSGVYQSMLLNDDVDYFAPYLEEHFETISIANLLHAKGKHLHLFKYPKRLFELSRLSVRGNFLIFLALPLLFLHVINLVIHFFTLGFLKYDVLWFNGNKVGLVGILFAQLFRYRGTIIWHFRDYPTKSFPFRYIWKLFSWHSPYKLILVGNSNSVATAIKNTCHTEEKQIDVRAIYNPLGVKVNETPVRDQLKTIGIVSMFARWKGIHQVILMAHLYHEELLQLGINEILIFGGELYKTTGNVGCYEQEIVALLHRYKAPLIKLMGITPPEEIYSKIDLLIHPSIEPEPFGRIIIEAFAYGVPVLTTGLGGSGELVVNDDTGLHFKSFDYLDLFSKIAIMSKSKECRQKFIKNGLLKLNEIESSAHSSIRDLFSERSNG